MNGLQEFTTTGTWTAPAGVTRVLVEMWGAGGGGGGAAGSYYGCQTIHDINGIAYLYCAPVVGGGGGGGGGGGYSRAVALVTPGSTYNIVVGAGGVGGGGGANDPTGAGNVTGGVTGNEGGASEIQDGSGSVIISVAGGKGGGAGIPTGAYGAGGAGGAGGSGINSVGRKGGDGVIGGNGGTTARGSIEVNPGYGGSAGTTTECDHYGCVPAANGGTTGANGYVLLTY